MKASTLPLALVRVKKSEDGLYVAAMPEQLPGWRGRGASEEAAVRDLWRLVRQAAEREAK